MHSLRLIKLPKRCARLGRRLVSSEAKDTQKLLQKLSALDTASLCDADKTVIAASSNSDSSYCGLQLMQGLKPLNNINNNMTSTTSTRSTTTMVGVARTVQCTEPNDFLAVLKGLDEAKQDEVLVINTLDSTRAVAGELFCAEAARRGVRGILVDGPMRDTAYLEEFPSVRCYSTSVTPYSGTIQSVGETQVPVTCGGAKVSQGDLVVGDNDGIIVGSMKTFSEILEIAYDIQRAEGAIKNGTSEGKSLHCMTNYEKHVKERAAGNDSSLTFTV